MAVRKKKVRSMRKPNSSRMPEGVLTASVDSIEPNDWNPNRQSDFMYQREMASIQKFGFIDPVTVRKHPRRRGMLQIIDGEHRWRAGKELGFEAIPITNLGAISDSQAKALTDILNNLRGEQDANARAKLLKEVLDGDDSLRSVLPYGDTELSAILKASEFDWDALGTVNEETTSADGSSGWVGLKVSLSPEQHRVVAQCIEETKKKVGTKSDAEALTSICRAVTGRK